MEFALLIIALGFFIDEQNRPVFVFAWFWFDTGFVE